MPEVAEVVDVFAAAGCRGTLCVQVDGGTEASWAPDEPVVAASVFKVIVAVAAETAFLDGRVDPTLRVRLPAARRTPGPTGFSLFADDVVVSARDLVPAMLTISDNVATDALLELLGIDACNRLAADLGLHQTVIVSTLADMIASIARDAGFPDWDAFSAWQSKEGPAAERDRVERAVRGSAALTPATATRTSARDMCTLLRAVWLDRAGPAAACSRVRSHLAHQLTRHRLAAAFPPPAQVAAKSGGLLGVVRNEVGVIRRPDGRQVYAAAFTVADPGATEAGVNQAIGTAAALAATAATAATVVTAADENPANDRS